MNELLCVFDVGTSGTRTIIFDINGKEISKAYEEYPVVKQPTGISEQDPNTWWNAVKKTCNLALKSINKDNVIGIAASFFRGTATYIDKSGTILHPALTWQDEREQIDKAESQKAFQEEGGSRILLPKLLWIKNNKPDVFAKADKIINPDSYLSMKLCGECVTEPGNAMWGILNGNTLKWDAKLADLYGLPLDLWPEIKSPGDQIGELLPEAATDLGLNKNISVILGGADQQCAALGLGAIETGQVKATFGTGVFVDMVVDAPITPAGDIPIFPLPHVIKGKWVIEGTVPGTGTAMKWFKDNFSQLQAKECEEKNLNVYEILTAEAKNIPPGSEGLMIIPLYIFRKGTIHGLGWNHTRAHMIRALMESAALAANMYIPILEGMAHVKTSEIRADGGGMNSDLWAQIFADVVNKKVLIPENKDGGAMGAAILGFYGCKKYNTIENAVENMVRFVTTKEPDKKSSRVYKRLSRTYMSTILETLEKKRVTGNL